MFVRSDPVGTFHSTQSWYERVFALVSILANQIGLLHHRHPALSNQHRLHNRIQHHILHRHRRPTLIIHRVHILHHTQASSRRSTRTQQVCARPRRVTHKHLLGAVSGTRVRHDVFPAGAASGAEGCELEYCGLWVCGGFLGGVFCGVGEEELSRACGVCQEGLVKRHFGNSEIG